MKKVLSVIIAIVMIASCMPMAFGFEFEGLEAEILDISASFLSSGFSVYTKDGVTGVMGVDIPEGICRIYEDLGIYDFWDEIYYAGGLKILVAENPEKAAEILEGMKEIQRTVEAIEVESEYKKVIYLHRFCIYYILPTIYYNEETNIFPLEFIKNECDQKKLDKCTELVSFEAARVYNSAFSDPSSVTQADFDAAMNPLLDFVSSAIGCYEGQHIAGEFADLGDGTHKADCTFCNSGEIIEAHTYGEYTPNGDATTEADGTKTAKCDKCDATDTVADEGSKLVEDIAQGNFFNNIIDKIMSFFESIINFFKNLFN